MPQCNQCGNKTVFEHHVSGTETRIYDETGDFLEVENDSVETDRVLCGDCGSHDIDF